MKKIQKFILMSILGCIPLFCNAQLSLPADFETPLEDTAWTMFANGSTPEELSIVVNPDNSGVNPSGHCLKFIVSDDADRWVGAYSDYYGPIEITEDMHTIHMMVYKVVISPIGLKLEQSLTGSDPLEITVSNTLTEEWELLSFDFSELIGHSFERITFFPDFPPTDRLSGSTCYIDNIGFDCIIADFDLSSSISPPLCHGGSDGSIEITVDGTYPPFTYAWSTGDNTANLENVPAGEYTLEVFDAVGCTESNDFTIIEPYPLSLSENIYEPLCHGDENGAIRITPSGGTTPYEISWDTDDTSDSIFYLPAGCYNVEVSDAHECTVQKEICLTEPDPLALSLSKQDNLCHGDSTGSITVSASGGAEPYEILLNGTEIPGNTDNLPAGEYTMELTDAHGCSTSDNITLVDPAKITISDISGQSQVEPYSDYIYSVMDQEGYTFHWMVEGGNLLTGQGSNMVAIQWSDGEDGVIMAVAESDPGCLSDTASLVVSINPGSVYTNLANQISIYPNPVQDHLSIEIQNAGPYLIEISSVNGILEYMQESTSSLHHVDISHFPKGLYILTIRINTFILSKKIIKQH